MRSKRWPRPPSPSLAVAILALVIAMTGGAFAASSAVSKKKKSSSPSINSLIAWDAKSFFRSHRGSFTGPGGVNGTNGLNGTNGTPGAPGPPGGTGPQGLAGPSHSLTWNVTTNFLGTGSANGGAAGPGVFTLATVGPFTILGKCTQSGSSVYAWSYLRTSQPHSAMDDAETGTHLKDFGPNSSDPRGTQPGGQHVLGDVEIGDSADDGFSGYPSNPAFGGPDFGSTAAISGDSQTYINAFTNESVFPGSKTGSNPNSPSCEFNGYVVSNVLP